MTATTGGSRPLPGALELVRPARTNADLPFCVFTNGTVKTPEQCADALQQAGPSGARRRRVLTPASTAVESSFERGHRRVMVLGGKGITEPLEAGGIETLPPLPGTPAATR